MKLMVFSTQRHDRDSLTQANEAHGHEIRFLDAALHAGTATLARGWPAVCAFTNDRVDRPCLDALAAGGTRLVALRCAGFNQVDVAGAEALGVTVARVPRYSPHAVAEHATALLLALDRKIHRAYNRVREGNFALQGLLGFDLHGKTVGVVGTGKIGAVFARILHGFGCRLLGHDARESPECLALGMRYVPIEDLLAESDVVSLHCPLTPQTLHLINDAAIARMKPGVVLLNTSRGAVVDTRALIRGLKSGRIGALGLDVYEEEGDLFFKDLSDTVLQDDVFARLLTFPNVLITGHQAFFTREALANIAETTLANVAAFERGAIPADNVVTSALVAR